MTPLQRGCTQINNSLTLFLLPKKDTDIDLFPDENGHEKQNCGWKKVNLAFLTLIKFMEKNKSCSA